jgi:hypothetical protein
MTCSIATEAIGVAERHIYVMMVKLTLHALVGGEVVWLLSAYKHHQLPGRISKGKVHSRILELGLFVVNELESPWDRSQYLNIP